jgi:diguanylate cyclase (GGDEF)-like protein
MALESAFVRSFSSLEEEPNTRRQVRRSPKRDTFAVLLLDIDHFGEYNDIYGHLAGNELLKAIAGIIQSVLRTTDLPARLECDVFAVMLPETSAQGAVAVAERLRAAIASYSGTQPVSVSIGISSKKRTTLDADQILHEADQALVLAKKLGRNCVIHYDLTQSVVCQPQIIPSRAEY